MDRNFSSLGAVLRRRFWPALATFTSVIGASIAYMILTPPLYEATARLIVDDKRVSVSELGRDLTKLPESRPGRSDPNATQAELIKSQNVLQQAVEEVFPAEIISLQGKTLANDVSSDLEVKIVPATNILEVSYRDEDPELASRMVNAVARAIIQETTEAIRKEAKAVRDFLEVEVPRQRESTLAAEEAESKYRNNSGIVSFDQQAETLVESLAALENQETLLLSQLEEKTAQVQKLQQITDHNSLQTAYAAGRIGQDQELENLKNKLAEVEQQLIESRSRLTGNHPEVQKLTDERNALANLYQSKVAQVVPGGQSINVGEVASDELSQSLTSSFIVTETERLALVEKLKALQAERARLKNRLDLLPIKQKPLSALVRQREEATESLKFLHNKLEEARLAEAQLVSNIRVIDPAQVPTKHSWPNTKAVLVVAGAAGIMFAVGMVLLLENLDNTLHDSSEVEGVLELPTLGVLPDLPADALSLEQPERFLDHFGFVEPYRLLLKSLDFRTQEQLSLLVISSTIAGEGKSVVASHLAALAAMLSRRTLIIDADLRRPRQHSIIGISPQPGLTDVLNGRLSLLEAAQTTRVENLFALSCGQLSERPSALLESAAMKSLLREAKDHYELIIIDTPPVSSCADAQTLSRHGDGLVMVTRPNFTPKDTAHRAVSTLQENGASILGAIVNGMSAETEKYYRYAVDGYRPISELSPGLTYPEAASQSSIKS